MGGCVIGNGTLLLAFLEKGPRRKPYTNAHLTGSDYSEASIALAKRVELARRERDFQASDTESDSDDDSNSSTEDESEPHLEQGSVTWRTSNLLTDEFPASEKYDLVLDKGTYDALALSSELVEEGSGKGKLPSVVYPEKVAGLVEEGGYFLITCESSSEDW